MSIQFLGHLLLKPVTIDNDVDSSKSIVIIIIDLVYGVYEQVANPYSFVLFYGGCRLVTLELLWNFLELLGTSLELL